MTIRQNHLSILNADVGGKNLQSHFKRCIHSIILHAAVSKQQVYDPAEHGAKGESEVRGNMPVPKGDVERSGGL